MVPPNSEYETGRKLCCTALYDNLSKQDAEFGEVMGIEQPLFYKSPGKRLLSHLISSHLISSHLIRENPLPPPISPHSS